jgi:hypothetical protein
MTVGPVLRDHTALRVAAGLARMGAVLTALAALGLGVSVASPIRGIAGTAIPIYGLVPGALIWLAGLLYSVVLWAGADVFIMLADSDDAHRRTHFELRELRRELAAAVDARGQEGGRPGKPESAPWGTPPPSRT